MKRTSEVRVGKEVRVKPFTQNYFLGLKTCASVLQYFRREGDNIIHHRQPRQNQRNASADSLLLKWKLAPKAHLSDNGYAGHACGS